MISKLKTTAGNTSKRERSTRHGRDYLEEPAEKNEKRQNVAAKFLKSTF